MSGMRTWFGNRLAVGECQEIERLAREALALELRERGPGLREIRPVVDIGARAFELRIKLDPDGTGLLARCVELDRGRWLAGGYGGRVQTVRTH